MELTPYLHHQIVSAIRGGGFPHIAAESVGVPRKLFLRWLKRGGKRSAAEPYRSFAEEVRQAIAQARLRAEIAAYNKEPKVWLEHGPGKEKPDSPGWTGVVQACAEAEQAPLDVFKHPDIADLMRELLEILSEFPEARAMVTARLSRPRRPEQEPTINLGVSA